MSDERDLVRTLHQRYLAAVMTFGIDAAVTQAAKRRWEDAKASLARKSDPSDESAPTPDS